MAEKLGRPIGNDEALNTCVTAVLDDVQKTSNYPIAPSPYGEVYKNTVNSGGER